MATIPVIGANGGRSMELPLPDPRAELLHEVVLWQLAKRRAGTASTKTRSNVNGTHKKMYSQKGTGNARHGNRNAPIFVGGGVAFGPKPRDYAFTLPKKVRRLGLSMALADRVNGGKAVAVDGWNLDGKTKGFLDWASKNGLDGTERVLLVTADELVARATRNLTWVTPLAPAGLNVYDILRHERLVIDAAVLQEQFAAPSEPAEGVKVGES